ncbi:MAG: c-type cytochrome [Bacteroidia bacterium]
MKKFTSSFAVIMIVVFCSFTEKNPWLAPKEAEGLVNPYEKNPTAMKAGAAIFTQQCVVCHGEKGKGDGIAAAGLDPKPANLTSDKVQNNTDGSLFWKITNGRTPMPTFKGILTDQQRWQVVSYLREFRPKNLSAKK